MAQVNDATICHGNVVAVIDRNFVIHNVHSTPPLTLIVSSRLGRGIQSVMEMLSCLEKGGEGVAYSFNLPFINVPHLLLK